MPINDKTIQSLDLLTILRIGSASLSLILGFIVALSPNLVYAPQPRVVLFFMIAILPAILFGAESAARFKLDFKVFSFATCGAAAISFGLLFSLDYLAKPEQQIAVFEVVNFEEKPVPELASADAALSGQGLKVTTFIDRNFIIIIFPEQIQEIKLTVTVFEGSTQYSGSVKYTGNRSNMILKIGEDLK